MKRGDTAEVFYGADGKVYFRVKAGNGETIFDSQGYKHKADAIDVLEAHYTHATILDFTVSEGGSAPSEA